MRLIKVFGLAAIAGTAFMAIVGVGLAMAQTTLEDVVWCAKRENLCSEGQHFPPGTEIFATGTGTQFLSSLGTVSCTASQLNMTNQELLVHGIVTALAFGTCTRTGGEACTVIAKNLQYLFEGQLKSDHKKYEVRITEKAPNGPPQVKIECGMFISCTYTAKSVSIEAQLAFAPERLSISQELIVSEGLFCGANPVWHGTYTVQCRQNAGSALKNCWVKMEEPEL